MTQTEALNMALEALEKAEESVRIVERLGMRLGLSDADLRMDKETVFKPAITAIKETLAQPEQDCTRSHPHENMSKECELRTEIARLRNQLAQPAVAEQHKQEPKCIGKAWAMWGGPVVFDPPLTQTEQRSVSEHLEPVAWYRNEDIFGNQEMEPIFYATKAWDNCLPLYTHPPVPKAQPKEPEQNLKLMPREATPEMLKAMDECSMEGYDERLYAGHASSVYMAAWDAFYGQHCYCGDITNLGVIHRNDGPCHYPEQPKVRTGDCLLTGVCASEGHKIAPQRKPLTDEQVREIAKQYALSLAFPCGSKTTPEMFARAIEAAHGIKE